MQLRAHTIVLQIDYLLYQRFILAKWEHGNALAQKHPVTLLMKWKKTKVHGKFTVLKTWKENVFYGKTYAMKWYKIIYEK